MQRSRPQRPVLLFCAGKFQGAPSAADVRWPRGRATGSTLSGAAGRPSEVHDTYTIHRFAEHALYSTGSVAPSNQKLSRFGTEPLSEPTFLIRTTFGSRVPPTRASTAQVQQTGGLCTSTVRVSGPPSPASPASPASPTSPSSPPALPASTRQARHLHTNPLRVR